MISIIRLVQLHHSQDCNHIFHRVDIAKPLHHNECVVLIYNLREKKTHKIAFNNQTKIPPYISLTLHPENVYGFYKFQNRYQLS